MTTTLPNRLNSHRIDVTPEFVIGNEQGNVIPALARLLTARARGNLTNERKPIMLNLNEELPEWALN